LTSKTDDNGRSSIGLLFGSRSCAAHDAQWPIRDAWARSSTSTWRQISAASRRSRKHRLAPPSTHRVGHSQLRVDRAHRFTDSAHRCDRCSAHPLASTLIAS
jgi:hypothetical protein